MDTAFVRVKRCFALRLKNKVYIQVIRAWNELFRFMALRTRHISFILHLSEVKFTTRLVIPMDIDGLCWVPMDPIGFHSKNGYRRIPSDNICALFDFHLTSGTLSRQTYFTSVGRCYEYNFAYSIGKNTFPMGVYWKCMAKSVYLHYLTEN